MKCLIVILGPTASGKTELAIDVAQHLHSPILSADSRQIYKEMRIGTAAPSKYDTDRVRHYFVGELELDRYYSAACYEEEFIMLTDRLFKQHDTLVMCGGSMMYIDAVCNGIDEIPTISSKIRSDVAKDYAEKGLEAMCNELLDRDPELYGVIDLKNHKRVLHAIEVCRTTGATFSELRKNKPKERPFNIIKIGLNLPRQELFDRIGRRTDKMVADGLLLEAERLYPRRGLNSLNTVGYKEMFAYIEGRMGFSDAVEKIKRNTRVYAKKQLTWFMRDKSICWFYPDDREDIIKYIDTKLQGL